MQPGRLIALDWGTSSLRAYLLGDGGDVLDQRASSQGILAVSDFESVFADITHDWPRLPALACGMVGSARGWREAPYVAAPATLAQLAAGLIRVGPLAIVPGLSIGFGTEAPNVMRGEETQIVGAALPGHATVVLPGTHSKWVDLESGRVTRFTTYMTGELFAVLTKHSILASQPTGDADAFERGVLAALTGELAATLFTTRALQLAGRLTAPADYLSGLLIGDELRHGSSSSAAPLTFIGDAKLVARYQQALAILGKPPGTSLTDTAPRGLYLIAEAAGLLKAS